MTRLPVRSGPHGSARRARGVALIAVLWIVAALSIMVTGMVQSQRNEIRVVGAGRDAVQGAAVGQAAVQVALQAIAARTEPVARLTRVTVPYAGVDVTVQVIPLNGYIDLNRAQAPLLAMLLRVAGGLPPDAATALAQAIVTARTDTRGPPGPKFEAVEDLLQLPGVDYTLYARISGFVTSDAGGGGRVHPLAAPENVLRVLAEGRDDVAARIAAQRDDGQPGIDTTGLNAGFTDASPATRFKLIARVPLADGRFLLSSRWAELAAGGRDGVPWRIFHSDDHFEPVPARQN